MKRYAFYFHDKCIGEFELSNDAEAYDKAIELMTSLSYAVKNPDVTYKEIVDGEKKI